MKKTILILLALCLMLAVLCACAKQESPEAAPETPAQTPEAPAPEAEAPTVQDPDATVFPSAQALADSAEAARKTDAQDRTEAQTMLAELDEVYAPEADFDGFELLGAEAQQDFLIYYYMPRNPKGPVLDGFDYRIGITVVVCMNPEVTVDLLCQQMGIAPDADGFAYDEEHQQMYFTQDGHACSLQMPEGQADPEEMKKLCKLTKIPLD